MADRFVISTILKVLDQSTKPIQKIGTAWGKLSDQLELNQKKFQRVGKNMSDLGKKVSTRIGLPLAGFGTLAVRTAVRFEESMNKVGAITGAVGEQFKDLEKLAKELGATTQFSASQAADAMTFLGMAGLDTEKIMKAMPGTLQLAAAGGLELADAADIATNVMTSMGIKAEELGRINDVLAKTASSANTDIMQLAEAMRPVAPAAANLGIPLEQLNAMLGKMADAGERGGIAGTLLRNAMLAVVNPSKKMTSAMENAGINLNNFITESGKIKNFDVLVKQIGDSGLSTGEIFQAFGERGARAIQLLTAQGKDISEFTKQLEESEGTAAKMQERMMKGLPGAMKTFKSAFEGLQLSLVNSKVSDVLGGIIHGLAGMFQSLSKTSPEIMSFISIIITAGAAMGPVLIGIGQFVMFAPGIIKAIGGIGKAFMLLGSTILKIGSFMLANPIVLIITAIAVAALLIYKYWKPIKKFFVNLWNGVSEITKKIMGNRWVKLLTWPFIKVYQFYKWIFGGIKDFFVSNWEDILNIAKEVGKQFYEIITNPGKKILEFFEWVWSKIKDGIKSLVGFLPDWAKDKLGIKTVVETTAYDPSKIGESIQETKSSTDVTINVKSDEGTTATVEKVKTKGTDKPQINTDSFLGGFAGAFAQ